eukprot:7383922-Prymnesium_polylepis.1
MQVLQSARAHHRASSLTDLGSAGRGVHGTQPTCTHPPTTHELAGVGASWGRRAARTPGSTSCAARMRAAPPWWAPRRA